MLKAAVLHQDIDSLNQVLDALNKADLLKSLENIETTITHKDPLMLTQASLTFEHLGLIDTYPELLATFIRPNRLSALTQLITKIMQNETVLSAKDSLKLLSLHQRLNIVINISQHHNPLALALAYNKIASFLQNDLSHYQKLVAALYEYHKLCALANILEKIVAHKLAKHPKLVQAIIHHSGCADLLEICLHLESAFLDTGRTLLKQKTIKVLLDLDVYQLNHVKTTLSNSLPPLTQKRLDQILESFRTDVRKHGFWSRLWHQIKKWLSGIFRSPTFQPKQATLPDTTIVEPSSAHSDGSMVPTASHSPGLSATRLDTTLFATNHF